MNLDIEQRHLAQVIDILNKYLPSDANVYAFGSRARGDAKQYSDLDLAVDVNGQKLDFVTSTKLQTDFEDSLIPYTIDVLDLNSIDENFKKNIENDFVQIERGAQ